MFQPRGAYGREQRNDVYVGTILPYARLEAQCMYLSITKCK